MDVYVCFSDLLVHYFEDINEKKENEIYDSYLFVKLKEPYGKFNYFAYPMYTSEDNIPPYKKSWGGAFVKKYKTTDQKLYEAIKHRERIDKELARAFDPFGYGTGLFY